MSVPWWVISVSQHPLQRRTQDLNAKFGMDVPNHDAGDGITETVDRSNVPDGETAGAASASALKGAKKRKQRLLSMTVTPSVPTLAVDPKPAEKPRPSVNVNVLASETSVPQPPSTRKGAHLRRLVIADTGVDAEGPYVPSCRWTPRADSRLRDGVRLHGENAWQAISKEVFNSVKSPEECKQRWESHIATGPIKGCWSAEEDAILAELVAQGLNWAHISAGLPGRNRKQCRERWCNHLDPRIVKTAWTPEEDTTLMELQASLGNKWARISKRLPGRSENDVKNRWNSRLKHVVAANADSASVEDGVCDEDAGTSDEDDDVITPRTQAAAQASRKRTRAHSSPRGFFVEDDFDDRADVENAAPAAVGPGTARSCAPARPNPAPASLPPPTEAPVTSATASLRALAQAVALSVHREAERTSAWAASEDKLLSKAVARLGPNAWDTVSKECFGYNRSPAECLARYKAGLTRGSIKGLWSAEEDAVIKRCVESGIGKWSVIAEHVPGRNGKQCRERYENHLKPTVKKGGWSEEEEAKLQELHEKFGNRWSLISKHLPGRSDNDVKNRYHCWMKRSANAEKRRRVSRTAEPSPTLSPPDAVQEGKEDDEVESHDEAGNALPPSGGSSGSLGPVLAPTSRHESLMPPTPSPAVPPDHPGTMAGFMPHPHMMPQHMMMPPNAAHFPHPSMYGPPHMFGMSPMGFPAPPPGQYFAPPPHMYYPGPPLDAAGLMGPYLAPPFGYFGAPHMFAGGPVCGPPQAFMPPASFPSHML